MTEFETMNHLIGETNAMIWAENFCDLMKSLTQAQRTIFVTDPGVMVGWFANAIEAGRDAAR